MFDGMSKTGDTDEALSSFEKLKPRLATVKDPVRPSADPHSAAVTALLASDFLGHADLKDKVAASTELSEASLAELRTFARAILHCLTQLGGDWFPLEGKTAPLGALHTDGVAQRDALAKLLEANVTDASVREIIESIKRGEGDVDLVLDLRALAALADKHAGTVKDAKDAAKKAREHADKCEAKLVAADPKGHAEWREHVVRAWTLFAPKYEAVCAAAREVTKEGVGSTKFPPLYTVSRARRTRKRGSITPPAESLRPSRVADPFAPAPSVVVDPSKPTSEPPKVNLPPAASGAGELLEGEDRPSNPSLRRASPRYAVEMEVGIGSESNFYVGFTENLSAQGVFIATYSPKAMGSKVDVTLTLPTGAHMVVSGTVRWIRNASQSGDTWPGMGVQFDNLSDEQESKIREFIRIRDPLFFDDD